MTSRFPMVCDSCLHKVPDTNTCTAFPKGIPLSPMNVELHNTPRPEQGNDVVWEQEPGKEQALQDFLDFRMAAIDMGLIEDTENGQSDEEAPADSPPPEGAAPAEEPPAEEPPEPPAEEPSGEPDPEAPDGP